MTRSLQGEVLSFGCVPAALTCRVQMKKKMLKLPLVRHHHLLHQTYQVIGSHLDTEVTGAMLFRKFEQSARFPTPLI